MKQRRWWWGPRGMTKKKGPRDVPLYVFFVWNCFNLFHSTFFSLIRYLLNCWQLRHGAAAMGRQMTGTMIRWTNGSQQMTGGWWMMTRRRMMGERRLCSILVFSSTTMYRDIADSDLEYSQYILLVQIFFIFEIRYSSWVLLTRVQYIVLVYKFKDGCKVLCYHLLSLQFSTKWRWMSM